MAALSETEKLEARYAENPEGRYFAPLADAYRKGGRVDDALQLVTLGLQKHPDYLSAHIVLGRCYLDKKDDASALQAFEHVLELDRENIIALKSLAEITERMGQIDLARGWLQRLLVVDSMNTEAEEDLARLGGPLPAEAEAPAEATAEEATGTEFSFADEVSPDADTAPMPAIEISASMPPPPPPPPPVPAPVDLPIQAEVAPEPPALEPAEIGLEPVSFEPPVEAPPSLAPEGITAFDDSLQWGAGERTSRAISAEDIQKAERAREATAAAIDFLGTEGPATQPAGAPGPTGDLEPDLAAPGPPGDWSAAPEVPTIPMEGIRIEPPAEAAGGGAAEPMLTETVADLYLKQGFASQAAEVYRKILAQRPHDASVRAKLAALEPPRLSAAELGAESVGSFLKRIARATIGVAAPEPAPEPAGGPTPMDAAFSESDSAPAAPPGQPARPAPEAFSLDQLFGSSSPGPPPSPPSAPSALGASFDEFFGGTRAPEQSVRPREGQPARPSEDDLSSFNSWLQGLKR